LTVFDVFIMVLVYCLFLIFHLHLFHLVTTSVVTIASEPVSIDYDRSFEKNRDVDVDSMLHGHVD